MSVTKLKWYSRGVRPLSGTSFENYVEFDGATIEKFPGDVFDKVFQGIELVICLPAIGHFIEFSSVHNDLSVFHTEIESYCVAAERRSFFQASIDRLRFSR